MVVSKKDLTESQRKFISYITEKFEIAYDTGYRYVKITNVTYTLEECITYLVKVLRLGWYGSADGKMFLNRIRCEYIENKKFIFHENGTTK